MTSPYQPAEFYNFRTFNSRKTGDIRNLMVEVRDRSNIRRTKNKKRINELNNINDSLKDLLNEFE